MPHNLRNQVSSLLQPESDFWNLSLTKPFILSLTGWRDSDSIRLCTCKYLVCNSSIFCVMNPGPSTFIYYAHLLAFMACLNFFMASLIFFFFVILSLMGVTLLHKGHIFRADLSDLSVWLISVNTVLVSPQL